MQRELPFDDAALFLAQVEIDLDLRHARRDIAPDLAVTMARIANDACQRARVAPCALYASREEKEIAMGYAPDDESVSAQRTLLRALYPK